MPLSKCCGAEVTVGGSGEYGRDDEGTTHFYECGKCLAPCDTKPSFDPIELAEWVKEEIIRINTKKTKIKFYAEVRGMVYAYKNILSYLASHGITPKE